MSEGTNVFHLLFGIQTARELKNKIESHMKSAFRYGIATKRLCDEYSRRLLDTSKIHRVAGVVMVMETGQQATFAGAGQMYDKFKQTGIIDGYTGFGSAVVKFNDKDAKAAPLRIMSFRDTYKGTGYKPSCSN